jgi:GMP synthase-like glutamine amidotransferase
MENSCVPQPYHFLVVESESPEEREARRRTAGQSAGETYADTLREMEPDARVDRVTPADGDEHLLPPDELARYDAVFVSGSPLHVYEETDETRRQITFMRAVFASGTPSFGSCAGLQLAAQAAGGTVRSMGDRREAGITRGITATAEGRDHPLIRGRPASWDALTIHGDEVAELPPQALLIATNDAARVQAVEIRHDAGIFWGVQYHPELSPGELGIALRRDADGLIGIGLAADQDQIEDQAAALELLQAHPDHRPTLWRLGVNAELAEVARRRTELRNFINHLVAPARRDRGR